MNPHGIQHVSSGCGNALVPHLQAQARNLRHYPNSYSVAYTRLLYLSLHSEQIIHSDLSLDNAAVLAVGHTISGDKCEVDGLFGSECCF